MRALPCAFPKLHMHSLKALLVIPVAAIASTLHAQIAVENFGGYSAGNNLTTPLNAGSGWNGAWTSAANNGTLSATGSVSNGSPLSAGSGQYLSVGLSSSAAGASMGVGRELAGGALATSYTISFQWRADSLAGFSTTNDRFEFFSANTAGTVHSASVATTPTANNSPYLMGAFGAARGSATALNFGVYNPANVGDAFDTNRYFNLGSVATGGDGTTMALVAGTTYNVSISVDVDTQTWAVSVDNGLVTASSTGLKWWGSATQPFVAFGARGDAANEIRSFSVDNISVSAVPEPASAGLLMGMVALSAFALRRRRR